MLIILSIDVFHIPSIQLPKKRDVFSFRLFCKYSIVKNKWLLLGLLRRNCYLCKFQNSSSCPRSGVPLTPWESPLFVLVFLTITGAFPWSFRYYLSTFLSSIAHTFLFLFLLALFTFPFRFSFPSCFRRLNYSFFFLVQWTGAPLRASRLSFHFPLYFS